MITFIILTYKRNDLLNKLLNQFIEFSKTFDIELYIYDNNPENVFNIKNIDPHNLKINYIKREYNIGADLNYFYSLNSVSKISNSNYTSIISDDDIPTYEYLKEINILENSGLLYDYFLCNNLILYNFKTNIYTLRNYKNSYYEVLDKHTTITGTSYSNNYLKFIFNHKFTNEENLKLFSYPMTFTFLFSKNYHLINTPCLFHTIENEIFWGTYIHFDKFYYNRLYMYQICFINNLITYNDFYFLSKRLITRNNILYYYKLFKSKNLLINKNLLKFLIPLLYKNFIKYIFSFSKKLVINVKNTISS
jgi:hypothetical protein